MDAYSTKICQHICPFLIISFRRCLLRQTKNNLIHLKTHWGELNFLSSLVCTHQTVCFYFRVALNYFITVPNWVYSLLIHINYQIRLTHVWNLLFFASNAFRMNWVPIVAKLSVQVVTRSQYYLQACVVIVSSLLSNKLKWNIVVPIETIHTTIRIVSYILK